MIKDRKCFDDYRELTEEKIDAAIYGAAERVKKYIPYFGNKYPTEASKNNVYPVMNYRSWVEGFYTGALWLCYELTGDSCFLKAGENHFEDFKTRIETKDGVDSHDMGFLYTLSCVAQYKITGNEAARRTALLAAKQLMGRFQEKGQFIQAWGELGDEKEYRLIVDCLLNIPLLYWAYEETGEESFKRVAEAHFNSTRRVAIREDGSTYHTFYFDRESGLPKCGKTHQGYSDESAWARGQAWCIYGFMLKNYYIKNDDIIPEWLRITDYYLNNIPDDKIAYWDLCFKEGDEPRDSSSAVIAVCGILEGCRQGLCGEEYFNAAKSVLNAVIDKCSTENDKNSNGLITPCNVSERIGYKDHDVKNEVKYLSYDQRTDSECRAKFISVIVHDDMPEPELFEIENGYKIECGGTIVYINILSDGRIMHRNCINIMDGIETDAVAVINQQGKIGVVNGSIVRINGKSCLDTLSRINGWI